MRIFLILIFFNMTKSIARLKINDQIRYTENYCFFSGYKNKTVVLWAFPHHNITYYFVLMGISFEIENKHDLIKNNTYLNVGVSFLNYSTSEIYHLFLVPLKKQYKIRECFSYENC